MRDETDVLADEEPSVLGAAATLPADRKARRPRPSDEPADRDDLGSGVVHVFEAGTRTPVPIGAYIRSVWERRAFIVELARADLRGPRANTALGRMWSVLDPLFQASIYFFLFTVIRGGSGRPVDFLPALLAGVFLFSLSTGALSEGGRSIRRSKHLMLNSTFPRALLPIVAVYKGLLGFIPSVAVVAGVYLIFDGDLHAGLLVVPLLFCVQAVMNVGAALLVSTLIVFFQDASNFLGYVTRVLFFATPIIYPVALLPEGAHAFLQWQPYFPLFAAYQAAFSGEMPSWSMVAGAVAWAVVLVAIGARVFRKYEREFASHL